MVQGRRKTAVKEIEVICVFVKSFPLVYRVTYSYKKITSIYIYIYILA